MHSSTGYRRSGGTITTAGELNDIFQALKQNELLLPTRILTGYFHGAEIMRAVENVIKDLKQTKPDIIYLLDRKRALFFLIMIQIIYVFWSGNGRFWASLCSCRGLTSISRNITACNHHYAQLVRSRVKSIPFLSESRKLMLLFRLLTETKIEDMASLRLALEKLHNKYQVPHVVISSIPLETWLYYALPLVIRPASDALPHLLCVASSQMTSLTSVHAQCVPLIPGYYSGVGDLFSALLLAHFHPDETPQNVTANALSDAVSQALTKVYAVLQITHGQSMTLPENERQPTDDELDEREPLRRARRTRGRELALIRGQDLIRGIGIRQVREMMEWRGFWNAQWLSSYVVLELSRVSRDVTQPRVQNASGTWGNVLALVYQQPPIPFSIPFRTCETSKG